MEVRFHLGWFSWKLALLCHIKLSDEVEKFSYFSQNAEYSSPGKTFKTAVFRDLMIIYNNILSMNPSFRKGMEYFNTSAYIDWFLEKYLKLLLTQLN